jgi:DNA polymerase elongation subunit (family B)
MTDATVGLKTPWAWSNGRRIWVYEVTQELKEALTFKCPGCEQPVHYRSASGNGRRAHFVHTGSSGSGTGGGGACHGNGETDEHKIAKMWIADHIQHVSFRRQCPTCSSSATQTYAGATAHIERPMLCGKKPDVTVYDARDIEVATVEVEHTHATDASSRQAQWDTFGRDHVHEIHATDVLNHIYALWKAEQGAQQHIVLPEKRASCQSCQDAERKRQEEQKRSDAYWKACQQSASSSSSSSSSHKRIREQFEGKEEKKEENAAPKRAKSNEGLSFHKWKRRRVEPFDMDTTDLLMYVMDVEASSTFAALQNGTSLCKAQAVAERPTFWMHGVTDKGHSICAIVHDFYPYCYVRLPNGKVDLALFWRELEAFMKSVTQGPRFAKRIIGPRVLDVTLETDHNDLMYYRKGQDSVPFARITLCLPELIPMCRSQLLKNRFFNNTVGFSQTYESNVPFFLRLLINKKTAGCCWIKIPKGTYYHPKRMSSRAQIEVLVRHNDLQPLPYEGEYSHLGETRTLSFDIECKAKDKHFPKASESPIVLICASLKIRKSSGETSRELIGFGWPDSYGKIMNPPDGLPCTMFALADEERMLRAWKDFVLAADPDVFTGYNFINFDWPYIIERCEALGLRELAEFGRKLGAICEIKEKTQQSKAFGTQKSKQIVKMNGRINMDPLPLLIKSQTKYRSYKLNSMASALLDRRKDDVSHWQIPILHNGTDAQRAILARYCFQDALLADLMDEVEEWTVGLAEFDRIMGVTTEVRLSRGTQINGFTLLQSKASEKLYHVPHPPKIEVTNDKFVGAIVLEPVVGYYKEEPIATLDFNSLYPTIMAAFNLCYSTLLEEDERKRTPPDDYITSPDGKHAFIKPHLRRGLLADVQRFLLQERKRVKKQMAEEKDPIKKKTLNVHNFCPRFHFVLVQARQLQIKLGGNSLYGFTGARAGMLPCVAIAETVTAIGQVMITKTKQIVGAWPYRHSFSL